MDRSTQRKLQQTAISSNLKKGPSALLLAWMLFRTVQNAYRSPWCICIGVRCMNDTSCLLQKIKQILHTLCHVKLLLCFATLLCRGACQCQAPWKNMVFGPVTCSALLFLSSGACRLFLEWIVWSLSDSLSLERLNSDDADIRLLNCSYYWTCFSEMSLGPNKMFYCHFLPLTKCAIFQMSLFYTWTCLFFNLWYFF